MDKRYYMHLAHSNLTANEYKILLMLLTDSYTASQLVKEIGKMKNNTDRHIRKLKSLGLIELDRVEGGNKYYKAVCDMKKLMEVMPGQLKL